MKKRILSALYFCFAFCLIGFASFGLFSTTMQISEATEEQPPEQTEQLIKEYSSKDLWQVIEAPIPEFVVTKTNVLIDNNYESNYQTKIDGDTTPFPHTFVVDMTEAQPFNFFEVCVRNNESCFVHQYQLLTSLNGRNYNLVSEGTLNYTGNIATIEFDKVNARYFKFVAVTAGSDKYTVIAEFSHGLIGKAEQIISPNSEEFYTNEGFVAANGDDSIVSRTAGSSLLMKFTGSQVNIFANTNIKSGKFDVFIDGHYDVTINLSHSTATAKLVYVSANLGNGTHAIEIKTLEDKEVKISYMTLLSGQSLINASNIMQEVQNLTISLVVFCILFALTLTFIILYFAVPNFKNFINNLFSKNNKDKKENKTATNAKEKTENKPVSSKKVEAKTEKPETNKAQNVKKAPTKTTTKTQATTQKTTKQDNKNTKPNTKTTKTTKTEAKTTKKK